MRRRTTMGRHLFIMLGVIGLLGMFGMGTESATAAVCDSSYRVTVWDCGPHSQFFPVDVVAVFTPGGSDTTKQLAPNSDQYYPKPPGAGAFDGAWVRLSGMPNYQYVPLGSTVVVPTTVVGMCLEVRVTTDPAGCPHIHLRCIPCPPEGPLE